MVEVRGVPQKELKHKVSPVPTGDAEVASEFYTDYPTRHVMSAIQEMYSQAGVSERKNDE
jgi:hypothetical protein